MEKYYIPKSFPFYHSHHFLYRNAGRMGGMTICLFLLQKSSLLVPSPLVGSMVDYEISRAYLFFYGSMLGLFFRETCTERSGRPIASYKANN